MRIHRTSWFFVFSSAVITGCEGIDTATSRNKDDQAIICDYLESSLENEWLPEPQTCHLYPMTTTFGALEPFGFPDNNVNSDQFDRMSKDTWADFVRVNKSPAPLPHHISLPAKVKLLREIDYNDWLGNADPEAAWDRYSRDHPSSRGHIQVSRIGYDKNRTQALFCTEEYGNAYSYSAWYHLYEKVDGQWRFVDSHIVAFS